MMKYVAAIGMIALLGCDMEPCEQKCQIFDRTKLGLQEGQEGFDARFDYDGDGEISILDFGIYVDECS